MSFPPTTKNKWPKNNTQIDPLGFQNKVICDCKWQQKPIWQNRGKTVTRCHTYLTSSRPPTFLKWSACLNWCKTGMGCTALAKGEGGKRGTSQQRAAAWWCHMTILVTFPYAQSALRRERDGTDGEESSLRARWHFTLRTHIGQVRVTQHQWAWPEWPRLRPPRCTANDAFSFI